MKKLSNRIGGSVLALLLVLSLCVSPLASVGVHAQEEGLSIKAKADVPEEIEATGKPVDMSGYFTVYCNGEKIYGMYDHEMQWFEDEGDGDETLPYSDTLIMHYKDESGTELEEAPSKPGKYEVSAEFMDYTYLPYREDLTTFETEYDGWFYSAGAPSDTISFTIIAKEGDKEEDKEEEKENIQVMLEAIAGTVECPDVDFNNAYSSDPVMPASLFKVSALVEEEKVEAEAKVEISYFDEDGNQLESVPWRAGSYTVRAALAEGTEVTCGDKDGVVETSVSAECALTLVKTPLYIILRDDTPLEFTANGEAVDFSEYFTFRFKGVEPILIFKGFRDGNGYWRSDYENYSDEYAEYEGYLPYKDFFEMQYYDADGNELEGAPSEPGKYSVKASIPDLTADDGMYAPYLKWSENDDGELEDEHYYYREGAESEIVQFTIKEASSVKPSDEDDEPSVDDNKKDTNTTDTKKTVVSNEKDTKTTDTKKAAAKTGDTSQTTLYLVLLVACVLVLVAVVQRRRRNFR